MAIRKTSLKERRTYTYSFVDGTKIVLRPGEDGITEEDIKLLHSLDDAEVYNNIKNAKSSLVVDMQSEEGVQREWNLSLDAMLVDSESSPSAEDEYFANVDETEREMVDRILCFLTDKQREVYYLVAIVGLTQKEAAKEMGTNLSTTNEHWLRALERIEAEKKKQVNNYN